MINMQRSDEPTQQLGTRTGGSFPPTKGNRKVSYAEACSAKSATPMQGPTSTGKGGIQSSLKVKHAGTKDAPGLEKTVNLF